MDRYGSSFYDIHHRMPLEGLEELVFGVKVTDLRTDYVVGQQRGEEGCYGHYYDNEVTALKGFATRYAVLMGWTSGTPVRCSTMKSSDAFGECTGAATHMLIARPIDRETQEQEIFTDPVCLPCGEGYCRRPSERATLERIPMEPSA